MSWPDDWTRGRGTTRPAEADQERTQVLPNYRTGERAPRPRPPGPPPSARYPGNREQDRPRRFTRGLSVLLVLLLAAAGGLYFYVDSHLKREDALADYPGRPDETPGQDWLIVGSDSRDELSREQRRQLRTGTAVGRRTDTIMLLHIGDNGATLVSLPRDSFVDIPAYTDGRGRRRRAHESKLNTSYSLGGSQLLARTVEKATDIRLDHYMEIGFGGFVGIVDSVGGVELCLDKAVKDRKSGTDLRSGCQQVDGSQGLSFVRARSFDPRSDLGRVERQQQFLRALTKEIASPAVLLNPFQFFPVMNSSIAAVTVDEGTGPFNLLSLFWNMRKLSGGDGVTTTVPVGDPDFRPGGIGSTVRWDSDRAEALFGALREDSKVSQPAKKG